MILITGVIKSGKSSYALELVQKYPRKAFIATAEPFDEEMKQRIKKHKQERDSSYDTYEEPLEVASLLPKLTDYDVILVECITTWLSNLLYYEKDIEKYTESFMNNLTGKEVIITNEVGLGIVPIDPLSRRYTDAIGKLNSKLARKADEVYLMVSSIPVKIK